MAIESAKIIDSETVELVKDGVTTCVPMVQGNSHYQEYLEWLAGGNEPLPASAP